MKCLFAFLILLSVALNSCNSTLDKTEAKDSNSVKVKISTAWIEQIRSFDYSRNTKQLLRDFNGFMKADTLINLTSNHVDEDYGRVINPIFIDLDSEPGEELICVLGWDYSSSSLCVFKQIDGDWYLLYKEQINTFYRGPSLAVAANFSKHKTFYLDRVYQHGSGVYGDEHIFYKLIDNKVYKVLNLLNETHIYGWGLYMNQKVKTSFSFRGDDKDELWVRYDYKFFPGAVNDGDCSWCANEDIPLITGDDGVDYVWDAKQLKYKLEIPAYKNDVSDLTQQKIDCFGDFGNDSLFVIAFKGQINLVLKEGNPQQQKILKKYLESVKSTKTVTTSEIEQTTKAGGTTFYK